MLGDALVSEEKRRWLTVTLMCTEKYMTRMGLFCLMA
jgi:hypothetical protein